MYYWPFLVGAFCCSSLVFHVCNVGFIFHFYLFYYSLICYTCRHNSVQTLKAFNWLNNETPVEVKIQSLSNVLYIWSVSNEMYIFLCLDLIPGCYFIARMLFFTVTEIQLWLTVHCITTGSFSEFVQNCVHRCNKEDIEYPCKCHLSLYKVGFTGVFII